MIFVIHVCICVGANRKCIYVAFLKGPQDRPCFWHQLQVRGLLKPTLVSNFLEELTELIKAAILTAAFYYREKAQIKITQGKSHMGQGPEGSKYKAFSDPPQWNCTYFSQKWCARVCT